MVCGVLMLWTGPPCGEAHGRPNTRVCQGQRVERSDLLLFSCNAQQHKQAVASSAFAAQVQLAATCLEAC